MQESSIVLVFFFPVLECRRTLVLNYDVQLQVFEVAPSLFMVELRKAHGDTLEYHNFYNELSKGLKDIVWR
jgi:hypothetical protein